eukprot:TRINITY_DN2194_c0_g1_i1.p1 TRINITY_DN2194_c0_g1~~TRINITY_DN2194_c0_g1_i1.p1  ORF type:complete len:368 (+),score=88.09 TRINITY_DN2194_c0_g1_i1:59-1162(+)
MSATEALQNAVTQYLDIAKSYVTRMEADESIDRAEGQRFLMRMISYAINVRANYDVDEPRFFKSVTPIHKMYLDSPDTDYHRCNISLQSNRVYRISGRVPPGVLYYAFQMYGGTGRVGAHACDSDLRLGPDGSLELYLLHRDTIFDTKGANVLRGEGDEIAVIGRQYFIDRDKDPRVQWKIQLVHRDASSQRVCPEAKMTQLATLAGKLLENLLEVTLNGYQMMRMSPANALVVAGTNSRMFPTSDNRYTWARLLLQPGKVVYVRGRIPKCRYFSISLVNMWLETLDYFRNQIFLNHKQIVYEKDGSIEIAISRERLSHKNALFADGHSELICLMRELLPSDDEEPLFTIEETDVPRELIAMQPSKL